MDLIVTANGPGEVAAWLAPVAEAVRERFPAVRVSVFLPPCDFASGRERQVVAGLPGVAGAYGPGAYLGFALLGRRPPGFRPGREGAVLFLGGDMVHAALLAWRLGYPAYAYTEGGAGPRRVFRRYFVPDTAARDRLVAAGVEPARVAVVGDLMVDAVRGAARREAAGGSGPESAGSGGAGGEPLVALFPGSQPGEVRLMAPLLLGAAACISRAVPGARFALGVSPFLGMDRLRALLADPDPSVPGPAARLEGDRICLANGPVVQVVPPDRRYGLMARSTLALSQPGSITMELAALGVPAVVALPLNNPRVVPLRGLPGLLGHLPGVGPPLRAIAARRWAAGLGYFALPNLRAGRALVAEVKGVLAPADVAAPAIDLLTDPRRREELGRALRATAGAGGAAARLVAEVACQPRENPAGGRVAKGFEPGRGGDRRVEQAR